MSWRSVLMVCLGLVTVGLVAWVWFGRPDAPATASASTRPEAIEDDGGVFVWDFRRGHSLEAVKWPAGFAGQDLGYDNTFLWRDDRAAIVQVIGVDGTEDVYEVEGRQIYRIGDQVVTASVSLPGMTYEEVVAKFRAMAATWGITDLKNFELWKDRRRPGNNGAGTSSCVVRKDGRPEIYLTIRHNFGGRHGLDWYISMSFQEFEPRVPTTGESGR